MSEMSENECILFHKKNEEKKKNRLSRPLQFFTFTRAQGSPLTAQMAQIVVSAHNECHSQKTFACRFLFTQNRIFPHMS